MELQKHKSTKCLPTNISREKEFEFLWQEFDEFYNAIILENMKVIKAAKKKNKSLLMAPQI
jgi:hypothetical protein